MEAGGAKVVSKTKPKFLGIKEPDFTATGEALAELIKERIRSAPGNRWNKTGRLLASISSVEKKDGVVVVAGNDRLQRDETAQLFAQEVLPRDLDDETRAEIARAIFNAFTVEK